MFDLNGSPGRYMGFTHWVNGIDPYIAQYTYIFQAVTCKEYLEFDGFRVYIIMIIIIF